MAQIDLTFLTDFTGGNQEKMAKYINMFLKSAPETIREMQNNLAEKNYDKLRGTAHALKPQITYMGIKNGEDLIKRIESNAGEKREVESLPKMLDEFISICNQAMVELNQAIA